MNIEDIREYCMAKPGVTESFPFGEDVLVFKVMGKMFLLSPLNTLNPSFNAKCEPEKAMELRDTYEAVQPGYHMNKKHWNTVSMDGSLSDEFLLELVDDSYELIVVSLKKSLRKELDALLK